MSRSLNSTSTSSLTTSWRSWRPMWRNATNRTKRRRNPQSKRRLSVSKWRWWWRRSPRPILTSRCSTSSSFNSSCTLNSRLSSHQHPRLVLLPMLTLIETSDWTLWRASNPFLRSSLISLASWWAPLNTKISTRLIPQWRKRRRRTLGSKTTPSSLMSKHWAMPRFSSWRTLLRTHRSKISSARCFSSKW